MSFYMATTSIAAEKTAMEIGAILAAHGATNTMTTYEKGLATGLSFRIIQEGKAISFQLPIRDVVDDISDVLRKWAQPAYISLMAGEMTAQENRTSLAIVRAIRREIEKLIREKQINCQKTPHLYEVK